MRFETKVIKLFIVWVVLLFSVDTLAITHRKPVPSLPTSLDPIATSDVFSIHAIAHVHSTLFDVDSKQSVSSRLVEEFEVLEKGKKYSFVLKKIQFHDGSTLSANDVKWTIERAILKKVPGFERLDSIRGFQNFIRGKSKEITGIVVDEDTKKLSILLSSPTPSLIQTLADFRYSVLKKGAKSIVGLGNYSVQDRTHKKWTLKRVHGKKSTPEIVEWHLSSQAQAIHKASSGYFHDLFSYSLSHQDIKPLKEKKNIQTILSPRTYMLAANPNSLSKKSKRNAVFSRVDREKIIEKCYPGNELSSSYIPPGFLGYEHEQDLFGDSRKKKNESTATQNSPQKKERLRISVAIGVGNEKCVVDALTKQLGSLYNVKIKAVPTGELVKNWQTGKSDIIFLYMESELTFDLFQFFNPDSTFSFGVRGDKKSHKILADLNGATTLLEKQKAARKANLYFMDLQTIMPIFHPKNYLVFDKRYRRIESGIRSATFVDASFLEVK